jgi:hypothetical protein
MRSTRLTLLALALTACAKPLPAPKAPAAATPEATGYPDEGPVPPENPRTPLPAVVDHPEIKPLKVVSHFVDRGFETIVAETGLECYRSGAWEVRVEGPATAPRPWSGSSNSGKVVIRRPFSSGPAPRGVTVFQPLGVCGNKQPDRFHFALPERLDGPDDPAALATWAEALAEHVRPADEWGAFADSRLRELYVEPLRAAEAVAAAKKTKAGKKGDKKAAKVKAPSAAALARVTAPRRSPDDLLRLMDTTTGSASLQETLQHDRRLVVPGGEAATVVLATLTGPPIPQHPWGPMTAALGRTVPVEPLAAAAPGDFAFVRFQSLTAMFALLDRVEGLLRPAAGLLEQDGRRAALAARYEAELGVGRSALARRFGAEAVTDLAVVASDPYLREGADVTLIFRVKSPALFDAGLTASLAAQAAAHGGVSTTDAEHNGVAIRVARSADGAVHQHRAHVGEFQLVGNSLGAIGRVIDAAAGRAPRLADEPDFRYMLARDVGAPADALAFMSDRFVATAVGPRQKILEARRQVALAELQRPAFASLLYGWVHGRAPASTDELVASGLLRAEELKHGDGQAIAFTPGQAPRSPWGKPAALVALADLPVPAKVTPSEAEAYKMFVRGYESYWRTYLDPVAIRVTGGASANAPLGVDVRVLPILDGTDYNELARTVGEARIQAVPARRGARATLGLGEDAHLRRELRATARDVPLLGKVDVDWLGGWAVVGMDDVMWGGGKPPNLEGMDTRNPYDVMIRQLRELPIYAGVEVRQPATAALLFAAARREIDKAAPGILEWNEGGRHRDIPFVTIAAGPAAREMMSGTADIKVYYAFCKGTLSLSLSQQTLRRRIDDCVEGRLPKAGPAPKAGGAAAAQATFEADLRKDGPLARFLTQSLGLATTFTAETHAGRLAEAVLRGAPGLDAAGAQALGAATFGAEVRTPAGAPFELGEDGVRDPALGNVESLPFALAAMPRPAAQGMAEPAAQGVLEVLRRFHSDVAFDPEATGPGAPATRSLHVSLRVGGQ